MTLFDYLNFLAVAECRSITTAADLLHLTKSAVSHNLSKIEKELSVPLFFRGSSGWELTAPAGTSALRAERHPRRSGVRGGRPRPDGALLGPREARHLLEHLHQLDSRHSQELPRPAPGDHGGGCVRLLQFPAHREAPRHRRGIALAVARHMGITAGSSFTSVDDTSLVALAESGLGFNRPDGKKQANNF